MKKGNIRDEAFLEEHKSKGKPYKWEKELWEQTKKFLDSLDEELRRKFVTRLYAMKLTAENNRSMFATANVYILKPIKRWCEKIIQLENKELRETNWRKEKEKKGKSKGGIQWH